MREYLNEIGVRGFERARRECEDRARWSPSAVATPSGDHDAGDAPGGSGASELLIDMK